MAETDAHSDRMQKLQDMRVALVLLLSEENTKLMSQRQRASGKEIEIMCAERDHAANALPTAALEEIYAEDKALMEAVEKTELQIARMEQVLVRIDADISEMCQS